MFRNAMMAAVAVCLILPAASGAQDTAQASPRTQRPPRAPRAPRVRVETRNGPFGVYAFSDNRARIGVIVDTHANATNDKVGARIDGITPGSPAEKAGLKAGDIITRFNGTALGGAKAEQDEDSGPGMKLIELARGLDPGDTVQIEYRRANESKKATVVAQDLDGDGWMRMPGFGGMEGMPKMRMGPGESFEFAFGRPWGGIELVKLNPDLGAYFGARDGVLVVSAPRDSTLALKGGDVITAIGARKPSSPEQAMRILRSYDSGDTVTINVLRNKKTATVTWVVPENDDRYYREVPRMREEPSWFEVGPEIRRRIAIPPIRIRDLIRTSRAI